jgi:hypothetical protein
MGTVSGLGQRLELRREAGGLRHYLGGEPVHAGDLLELWRDGAWLTGRYEWNARQEPAPALYLSAERSVGLTAEDLLRWPGRRA